MQGDIPFSYHLPGWKNGKIRYGFFEKDKCPFFLLAFNSWNIDVSINILQIKSADDIDKWLNSDGNIINLFLIDAAINILRAMRTISIPKSVAEYLKDVLEAQSNVYDNAQQVKHKIDTIAKDYTSQNMLSKAQMFKL